MADGPQNLVWSGFGSAGPGVSHAVHVCNFRGEPHLCFYQGTQMLGWGMGHGVIMDKHYRIVMSVEAGSFQATSDMHEFYLLPDGRTALLTQFLRSAYDLCDYGICSGLGYLQEGAFQEVDVETGKVVFEWRSLDHIDLSESYVGPGTTEISGTGREAQSPWDYFHINSVDKNDDGDYLISARHTSAIYKISGKDGHVIWRLNGERSDFKMVGFPDDVAFSFQHDARWLWENETASAISLFDNGSNGFNLTQQFSQGMVVVLDHVRKTATKVQEYNPPILDGSRLESKSQGNTQVLPDGNVVCGWGNQAFWSEHAPDGSAVWFGSIGLTNVMNYRTHKFNWTGLPLTKPALWTYSRTSGDDGMMVYASWNGHTEIKKWSYHTGPTKEGPWTWVRNVDKHGFETAWRGDRYADYSYVVALDARGAELGRSEPQRTFVPPARMLPFCDGLACVDDQHEEPPDAAAQKAEQEQKEAEEAEAERERAELREMERRRWLVGTLATAAGCMAMLALLLARRSVVRSALALGFFISDVLSFAIRRACSGYRALATEMTGDSHTDLAMSMARAG